MVEEEYYTIRKIAFTDKYMELWLDGKPYSKISEWDEETRTAIETDEDQWNQSTKGCYFREAFEKQWPDVDFDDLKVMNGWKVFYGFRIQFENTHPKAFKLPIELEIKALKNLL